VNQYSLNQGVNDIGTLLPELALQWDYGKNGCLTPADVSPGSTKHAWWRCPEGHSWRAVIYSRAAGHGCPYCSNNKVLAGFNDLAAKNPSLAREWDYENNVGVIPETIAPDSNKKVWWKCGKGHCWQAVVSSRNEGKGCPYCGHRKVLPGFNDLASRNPYLAAEWDYEKNGTLKPSDVFPSSQRKVWWKGKCGHEWQAKISNRATGNGCPYCSGVKVLVGFNDFASAYPDVAGEWDYKRNGTLTPAMVHAGTHRYIWWKCKKGHGWHAKVSDRAARGNGCPYCGNRRPVAGETDFRTMHPELMEEWDYEKNQNLDPENLTMQSRKTVWWKCEKGHQWQAEIYARVHGTGCPHCNYKKDKHRILPGVNDLRTVSPEIAEEWDEQRNGNLRPGDVMPYSNRAVWWKCKKGHHWRTSPNARQRGTGCPHCDGKVPVRTRII